MKKIALLFLLAGWYGSYAQDDQKLVEETVNQAVIKSHIGFLASDVLKGRNTPSPELEISAEYLKSRFVQYGVSPVTGSESFFQEVPMKLIDPPSDGIVTIGENEFLLKDDFLMMDGSVGSIEAPIVFVGYGLEEDLDKAKVKGKIVVSLCGDGSNQNPQAWFSLSGKKGANVKERGGLALIELYSSPQIPWNLLVNFLFKEQVLLSSSEQESLTRIWVNRSQNDVSNLEKKKTKGSVSISLGEVEEFSTKNVVGMVEGSDEDLKNEFVVYSAHYDHVGVGSADETGDTIYNGSRDNAVGTVTVLSAAENIAKYPTRRSALFILFTGEEKGLLGSNHFVENSPVELKNLVYCFNSDNGGYNDTSLATIIGLGRTTAQPIIAASCETFGLKAIDDPAPEQGLFDRSDNVHFAKKGIPAPTFSMGFTAFDQEIAKYYHQPSDEPETLDYEYLEKFFKAYVLASRRIANEAKAPFWVEGDKYFDAGVELYKEE